MDREQTNRHLEYLIGKLKAITLAIQLLPFVHGFLYVLAILVYIFLPEPYSVVCDHLFYVSVCVIAYNLILSKILKLCAWHKAACLVPLYPELVSIVDYFIPLTQDAAAINLLTIAFMSTTLLISAYFVFLSPKCHGRK